MQQLEMEMQDQQYKREMADARAVALRDAQEAFEKLDINGDGTIDRDEAAALIDQTNLLGGANLSDAERKAKIDSFF